VFAGYVQESAKVEYYNLADLLLFPSAMEGFGLTVAEAMSCELPVVVSDRGSLPELVVDGEGGFLVDPSDHDAFVRKTLLLCADPMLRKKLGAANGERVDRLYRWDHCAAATARVYEEVLEGWRRARRVVGMDYDVAQLRVAAAEARALGLKNVHLFAWDLARPFPFADRSFDAALFLDVIEHLHPRLEVLGEIRRVLKSSGRLLV